MDKTKIVPVILLVIILGVGFVAYSFYVQNLELTEGNRELRRINSTLEQERSSLEQRHRRAVDERRELERRVESMRREMDQVEQERSDLRDRYQRVSSERDELARRLEERPVEEVERVRVDPAPVRPDDKTADYWADFVQQRAELQARLEEFEQKLLDAQNEMAQLRRRNKELSLEFDEAQKGRERLRQEIERKERALRLMSMDLVSERQSRGQAVEELNKLREETSGLKNEIMTANRRKGKVQERLKEVLEERNKLERKIADTESILKERSLTFERLHADLEKTIQEGRQITAIDSGSVELPPIVVRPDRPDLRGLQGEIIAVNQEERFVVFNLGEEEGLRPGVVLEVMRGNRSVGTLEVIETRRNISAADIKEVAGGFNIREGDIVINK